MTKRLAGVNMLISTLEQPRLHIAIAARDQDRSVPSRGVVSPRPRLLVSSVPYWLERRSSNSSSSINASRISQRIEPWRTDEPKPQHAMMNLTEVDRERTVRIVDGHALIDQHHSYSRNHATEQSGSFTYGASSVGMIVVSKICSILSTALVRCDICGTLIMQDQLSIVPVEECFEDSSVRFSCRSSSRVHSRTFDRKSWRWSISEHRRLRSAKRQSIWIVYSIFVTAKRKSNLMLRQVAEKATVRFDDFKLPKE